MATLKVKEITLGVCAVVVSSAAFWSWQRVMPSVITGEIRGYAEFLVPLGALAIAGSLYALTAFFIKSPLVRIVTAAALIAFPYFVFMERTIPMTAVAVAAIGMAVFAGHRMAREFSLSLGISVSRIGKLGIPLFFTAAVLIITTFYAAGITEEQALTALFPRSVIDFTLTRLGGALGGLTGIPAITKDMTVDELLGELVIRQVTDGELLRGAPPEEFKELLARERENFSEQFGIALRGDENVMDLFYTAMTDRLRDLVGPYRIYLPFASAVAFFFALKVLTYPLYFFAITIVSLLIKVMRASKMLKSEKRTIQIEKLSL